MVDAGRKMDNAVPQPDVLTALAGGGEEYLRSGRVAVLLEEVVFGNPHAMDSHLVGRFDKLQMLFHHELLTVVGPGARKR
jgi:hypothetical protein